MESEYTKQQVSLCLSELVYAFTYFIYDNTLHQITQNQHSRTRLEGLQRENQADKTRDVTSVLVASFCYIVRVITKVPNKQLSISTMSYK